MGRLWFGESEICFRQSDINYFEHRVFDGSTFSIQVQELKNPLQKGVVCPEQESNLHILANDRF
jgi:hypothetical protein